MSRFGDLLGGKKPKKFLLKICQRRNLKIMVEPLVLNWIVDVPTAD